MFLSVTLKYLMQFLKSYPWAVYCTTDDSWNESDIEKTRLERNLGMISGENEMGMWIKWKRKQTG